MSKNSKKAQVVKEVVEVSSAPEVQKAKMIFSEEKFYNDMSVPYFEKNKIYEVVGADQIQRWVKRGGKIVEGGLEMAEADESNPSEIVGQSEEVANIIESGDIESYPSEFDSEK